MFELRVLGGMEIRASEGAGTAAAIGHAKHLGLLTYLAVVKPSGFHSRDKLVAMFWPEADTRRARGSLRKAIHHIRKSLGADTLVARAEGVGINRRCLWCDATALGEALADQRDEEALGLYRGDLLDGVFVSGTSAFEHWLDGQRTRLRAGTMAAARRLLERYRGEGNLTRAIEVAQTAIAIEPDEVIIRQLMEVLHEFGDQSGALRTYEEFAAWLAREYATEPSAGTRQLADRMRTARPEAQRAIVVLPFTNLNSDPDSDFISSGLTDDLISDLSKVRSLRVISHNSAMRLRGTTKDVRTIGRELNVRYALEGCVRKTGPRVEVTARLVETASDTQLWSDKLGGAVRDLPDLQQALSRRIVRELTIAVTPQEERRLGTRRLDNAHVYECYHRARQELWRFDRQGLERALELIQSGVELGGESDLLYALQGLAYCNHVVFGVTQDRAAWFGKTLASARNVARLNPESPFRFALPAMVQFLEGERQDAARGFKRALALNPDDPDVLGWLVTLYERAGHAAAARPLADRLLALDPLNPHAHVQPGWLDLIEHGDADSCVRSCLKAYRMDTQSPYGRFLYASALCWAGQTEESCSMFATLERDTPTQGLARLGTVLRHALVGDKEATLRALTPDLIGWAEVEDVASWVIGDAYALLGDVAQAVRWITNAANRGAFSYPMFAKHDPLLSRVRPHPDFQALLTEVRCRWEAFEP